jgi:hypothetical protein
MRVDGTKCCHVAKGGGFNRTSVCTALSEFVSGVPLTVLRATGRRSICAELHNYRVGYTGLSNISPQIGVCRRRREKISSAPE